MASAFPPLSDRHPLKRGRTEELMGFVTRSKNYPRFHVIHSEHSEKSARVISPFAVAKSLTEKLGPGYKITRMASGDLLLEVRDQQQYQKLTSLQALAGTPISVTPHRSMNTTRGVVSDTDLLELTEEELLDGWREQNVTNVQRIKLRRDNREIPTKHLILTFASSELPQTIETGYIKLPVRPYIPNPRRCFNCQRFGHGTQSCRGKLTCAKCGTQGHPSDGCTDEPHCANCDGSHAAYSRTCPNWRMEKDIIALKVRENISFREARKRVSPFHVSTFADAARQGAASHRSSPQARPARSEPPAVANAPTVGAAKAAPPSQNSATPVASTSSGGSRGSFEVKEVPSPSPLVGPKALSSGAKPARRTHRSLERVPSASHEAMDTTSCDAAQGAHGERKASLERSRKKKIPVTGPKKGSVM